MATIRCPMCQTENPVGEVHCRLCHAKLPEAPLEEAASGELEGGQIPDWLARLRREVSGTSPQEAADPPAPPASEAAPPGAKPPTGELGWLGELPQVADEDQGPPEGEVPAWVEDEVSEGEVPEWLGRVRARARGPETEDEAAGVASDETAEPPVEPEPPSAGLPEEPAEPADSLGLPEWLMSARPDEAPTVPPPNAEAARPAWLEGVTDSPSQELPRVPALVFDDEAEPTSAPPGLEVPSISAQVPDWIGDSRPAEGTDRADLAPATLPAWLEAMRPVESFRSVIEFEAEDDQAVESAGPLAGLRGVLLAEPVVAMPRASSGGSVRLDVNERQYGQAELLHRLVEDERREVRPRAAVRTRPDLMRWIVGLALLVAVGLPGIFGVPAAELPAFAPRDLAGLVMLVDDLPVDRPALVVFDYEAASTGEMEAVAGPLLSHLMSRGLPIATLSTHAGGSVLAERLMAQVGAAHNYRRGEDFVHLGYLPGGPAAVQLFAADPRRAAPAGFLEDQALGTVWASPVLQGVSALADFGALAIITSGSDDARAWIEQAEPSLGDSPLLAVVGAGAEPLVRPYFEATRPALDGILSGLTSATAYEQRLGRPALAHSRWGAYGLGLLAVEVLIVAGSLGGLIVAGLRARRR